VCGIAAYFSTRNEVSADVLHRAAKSLVHRGPDNQNVWIDKHAGAGLAHARLSLLDLSRNGDQPLSSANDRLKLVHNGEFYDFERIRKELQGLGHPFRTNTDSEILLPLYEEFGVAALAKLRGEFAFVLWNQKDRKVFAARDRFGIKPLFYAVHNGALHFASEVKALFAMGVPARWDLETVHQFHATWVLPPHHTLYKNVYQIPAGHFLTASGDFTEPRVTPYWDLDYPIESKPVNAEEEILKLRAKFEEAVRLRMRADVPVACYLSGGLDSCSVLGVASRYAPQPVHAFTLSFQDDALYDESKIAREMAEKAGAVYHEIPIRFDDLAREFGAAVRTAEIPFANTHGIAKFILSRSVRDAGFKAVLTGEGSDEIFGGYVHFRKDVLMGQEGADTDSRLNALAQSNMVSRPLMLANGQSPRLLHVRRALGYVPSFFEANAAGSDVSLGLLRNSVQDQFRESDGWRNLLDQFDLPRQLWGRPTLHQSLYLWSRTMLNNYLLTVLGDRMEMAHSIEGRLPFLDHELVEQVVKLPVELKIRPDLTEKYLLREAARPFITDTVYHREKHPFMAPPATTSPKSQLFQFLEEIFRSQSFSNNSFYDPARVNALLDEIPNMNHDSQSKLDGMMTAMASFALIEQELGVSA
jgi:asparagine synthase (glutamine-hydrolysing)